MIGMSTNHFLSGMAITNPQASSWMMSCGPVLFQGTPFEVGLKGSQTENQFPSNERHTHVSSNPSGSPRKAFATESLRGVPSRKPNAACPKKLNPLTPFGRLKGNMKETQKGKRMEMPKGSSPSIGQTTNYISTPAFQSKLEKSDS